MRPLFELIISAVNAPKGDPENPFLMHALQSAYDDYVGSQACGRILEGKMKKGQQMMHSMPKAIKLGALSRGLKDIWV